MAFPVMAGEANETGFELSVNGKEFKTKNYQKEVENPKRGRFPKSKKEIIDIVIITIIVSSVWFFIIMPVTDKNLSSGNALALLVLRVFLVSCVLFSTVFLTGIIGAMIGTPKLFRQWHACEHRVANVYQEKGKSASRDDLKRASKIHFKDGVVGVFTISYILSAVFVLAIESILKNQAVVVAVLILFSISLAGLKLMDYLPRKTGNPKFYKFGFLAFPVILAHFFQYGTTAEPEEWQTEESWEVLEKIKTEA